MEKNAGYNDEEKKEVLKVLAVVQCTWPPLLVESLFTQVQGSTTTQHAFMQALL